MRAIKLCILALLATCAGCYNIRNIPAEATPVPVRYYRTQDLANFAAGAGADLGLRALCHGPTQEIGTVSNQYGTRRFRWFSGASCPVLRVGTVTVLGAVRRQTDRGYREGGLFMNLYGATATEILHVIVDAVTKHWGPVR